MVTRWWLVCWSTEHHYYWKNWLWKTPFSNQYFVLCPWYLITLSMRLGIDSMPLSIISVGKAKTVWIILFENWLQVSLVRFLLTASSLSFLPIRWKTFSIRLRSGERAGILKKWHPTFSIAYLHTLRFFERSLSWKNNLPFLKHIRKLFFDKLYKLFSINSPFVLVTFNNTFTMWYSHHELQNLLFSLCATRQFEVLAPLSSCSRTKCFCVGCWIAFVDPRSTITVEWYTFCPEICGQFFALISKFYMAVRSSGESNPSFLHWK